jgi:hypothetical protein
MKCVNTSDVRYLISLSGQEYDATLDFNATLITHQKVKLPQTVVSSPTVYHRLGELVIDRATRVDTIVVCVTRAACACLYVLHTEKDKVDCENANDQWEIVHADIVGALTSPRILTGPIAAWKTMCCTRSWDLLGK